MMRNSYISETRLVDTAVRAIGTRLPPRWLLLAADRERRVAAQSSPDAIWEIRDPDGRSSDIIVEAKSNPVEPRLVGRMASELKAQSASTYEQAGMPPVYMLVSTYLSPRTRERLVEAGMSYADTTGNIRFTVESSRGVH